MSDRMEIQPPQRSRRLGSARATRPREGIADGGNPDPSRDHLEPQIGADEYVVVGRVWITRVVVLASVVFPVLVLAGLLLGLPETAAVVLPAVMTPLVLLARSVARFYFPPRRPR